MVYTFSCKFCGDSFSSTTKRRLYCSHSCAAKASNKGRKRSLESRRKTSASVRQAMGLTASPARLDRPKKPRTPRPRTAPLNPEGTAHRYGPYKHKATGYLYYADIYPEGKRQQVYAHRVVLKEEGCLPREKVTHHKNEDKTYNAPENLQPLTRSEHNSLHGKQKGRAMVLLSCPWCQEEFPRRRGASPLVPYREGKPSFCSHSCRASFYKSKLTREEKEKRLKSNVIRQFRDYSEVS